MTGLRRTCLSSSFALLVLSQPAFGQDGMDLLDEADARNAAYEFISATEARFECKMEEHSMLEVGPGTGTLYLFRLSVAGDECKDAFIFLTNIAARDGRLLFRQAASPQLTGPDDEIAYPLIPDSQILIHEVNPKDEEAKPKRPPAE